MKRLSFYYLKWKAVKGKANTAKIKCQELQRNVYPLSTWLDKFLSLYSYRCSAYFFTISNTHLGVLYKDWGKLDISLYQDFQTETDVIMIYHLQKLDHYIKIIYVSSFIWYIDNCK